MRTRHATVAALLLAALVLSPRAGTAAETLPKLGADLAQSSVSGLSSGAYMAGQIQVAHSEDIVGAGIVAGGPFACAESSAGRLFPFWPTAVAQNASKALYQCMQTRWGEPDPSQSANRAKELAEDGAIDPIAGLTGDNVYLFSGNSDQTVELAVVKAAKRFYEEAGVTPSNMTLVEGDGGHAFITAQGGAACGISDKPYVSNCGYNQAKAILAWIYGPLAESEGDPTGRFIVFDQAAFAGPNASMAREGVVYVPQACAEAPGCRVHVALHGCEQSRELEGVGDTFVKESGFAEAADGNRVIVLFPQAKASAANPYGCWDWWGYTGLDYLDKDAPQIKAIWSMVEQLAATQSAQASEGQRMSLEVGDKAPDFTLPADGGGKVSLKALRGKPVVLYFYPKDDTSGCTAEACAFRDALPDFAKVKAQVIGISRDGVASHDKFKQKYRLPFPLASDEDGKVCEAYGVWVEKSMYGRKYMGIERSTFLIDAKGVVRAIWRKVKVPGHAEAVLDTARALE